MEISFLGSACEVGRSAVLLNTEKSKVILDYGVKLSDEDSEVPLAPLPVPGFLDAVILSHAHLDHVGATPYLFDVSEPAVYTTPGSVPIIELLLEDSMKISRLKKNPCFSRVSLKRMLRNVQTVDLDQKKTVTPDISFKYSDAGHILGSAVTKVQAENHTVTYTGDIKCSPTHLHNAAKIPGKTDVLIIESTYGNKEHPDRKKLEKEFVENIKRVVDNGGTVLLPAFAVGRSQELVSMLYKHKISVPVYLDGMSRKVSEIYTEFPEGLRDYNELYSALKWVNWIGSREDRAQVFNEPSVVVSTAGMLSGGPALGYLEEIRNVKNSAVFFTGFQVPGTAGNVLYNEKKFYVNDVPVDYSHVEIKYFEFSAHADKDELYQVVKKTEPKLVLVNHGEEEQANAFKQRVTDDFGCYAFAPSLGDSFNVDEYI